MRMCWDWVLGAGGPAGGGIVLGLVREGGIMVGCGLVFGMRFAPALGSRRERAAWRDLGHWVHGAGG